MRDIPVYTYIKDSLYGCQDIKHMLLVQHHKSLLNKIPEKIKNTDSNKRIKIKSIANVMKLLSMCIKAYFP